MPETRRVSTRTVTTRTFKARPVNISRLGRFQRRRLPKSVGGGAAPPQTVVKGVVRKADLPEEAPKEIAPGIKAVKTDPTRLRQLKIQLALGERGFTQEQSVRLSKKAIAVGDTKKPLPTFFLESKDPVSQEVIRKISEPVERTIISPEGISKTVLVSQPLTEREARLRERDILASQALQPSKEGELIVSTREFERIKARDIAKERARLLFPKTSKTITKTKDIFKDLEEKISESKPVTIFKGKVAEAKALGLLSLQDRQTKTSPIITKGVEKIKDVVEVGKEQVKFLKGAGFEFLPTVETKTSPDVLKFAKVTRLEVPIKKVRLVGEKVVLETKLAIKDLPQDLKKLNKTISEAIPLTQQEISQKAVRTEDITFRYLKGLERFKTIVKEKAIETTPEQFKFLGEPKIPIRIKEKKQIARGVGGFVEESLSKIKFDPLKTFGKVGAGVVTSLLLPKLAAGKLLKSTIKIPVVKGLGKVTLGTLGVGYVGGKAIQLALTPSARAKGRIIARDIPFFVGLALPSVTKLGLATTTRVIRGTALGIKATIPKIKSILPEEIKIITTPRQALFLKVAKSKALSSLRTIRLGLRIKAERILSPLQTKVSIFKELGKMRSRQARMFISRQATRTQVGIGGLLSPIRKIKLPDLSFIKPISTLKVGGRELKLLLGGKVRSQMIGLKFRAWQTKRFTSAALKVLGRRTGLQKLSFIKPISTLRTGGRELRTILGEKVRGQIIGLKFRAFQTGFQIKRALKLPGAIIKVAGKRGKIIARREFRLFDKRFIRPFKKGTLSLGREVRGFVRRPIGKAEIFLKVKAKDVGVGIGKITRPIKIIAKREARLFGKRFIKPTKKGIITFGREVRGVVRRPIGKTEIFLKTLPRRTQLDRLRPFDILKGGSKDLGKLLAGKVRRVRKPLTEIEFFKRGRFSLVVREPAILKETPTVQAISLLRFKQKQFSQIIGERATREVARRVSLTKPVQPSKVIVGGTVGGRTGSSILLSLQQEGVPSVTLPPIAGVKAPLAPVGGLDFLRGTGTGVFVTDFRAIRRTLVPKELRDIEVGQRPRQEQFIDRVLDLGQVQGLGQQQAQRQAQRQLLETRQVTDTIAERAPRGRLVIPPLLKLPEFFGRAKPRKIKRKKVKRKLKFQPSLLALSKKEVGRRQRILTGFELRKIPLRGIAL